MNFALDEQHVALRDAAHAVLAKEVDLARLLHPGATNADASREALWSRMGELGWAGMIIPEESGGLGMSCLDAAMVIGECGRTLAPSPLAGTLAGTWAILATASASQQGSLLPKVASGECRLALAATDDHGRFSPASVQVEACRLTGIHPLVLDAPGADLLIVAAREPSGADAFFVVDRHAPGVQVEPTAWRDITRQVGAVRLSAAPAERLSGDAAACWGWIRDRLYLMLAAESAAGLHAVLSDTVDYAKQRVAFGRPIGAYQAIKHALADMKGWAECASASVVYAAWALSDDDVRAPMAAAMAQSYASDAYRKATFRSIQIFGAIGFTWEMRCHLFYKRARANAELLGNPARQRSEVLAMLEQEAGRRSAMPVPDRLQH